MKRGLSVVLLAMALTACASTSAFMKNNRENLTRLSYGMTKEEAHSVMGREGVRNYNNPYRTAMYMGKEGKPVEVFYYWTDHTTPYGIPERDLTPVVFKDGRVVGWGREFWSEFVTKYELRIKRE
jgi:uncharacterized protein DUF3192